MKESIETMKIIKEKFVNLIELLLKHTDYTKDIIQERLQIKSRTYFSELLNELRVNETSGDIRGIVTIKQVNNLKQTFQDELSEINKRLKAGDKEFIIRKKLGGDDISVTKSEMAALEAAIEVLTKRFKKLEHLVTKTPKKKIDEDFEKDVQEAFARVFEG